LNGEVRSRSVHRPACIGARRVGAEKNITFGGNLRLLGKIMLHPASRARLTTICFMLMAFASPAAAESRVVVELFTSQGCSSCPAADKLLGELSKDPSLLTISLAVDYWDYLGWKDTLALPGNAVRQRAYAGLRGDRAVYTPQAVVNGVTHVLGSDKTAIEQAVKRARHGESETLPIKLAVAEGKLNVEIAPGKPGQSGDVWLCPLTKHVPVQIGRGENRGNTITYTNVVRGWVKLGQWTGRAEKYVKSVAEIMRDKNIDAVAVLVQTSNSGAPGRVLGGATAPLH
jgi:hypothetical protein